MIDGLLVSLIAVAKGNSPGFEISMPHMQENSQT